MRKPQGHLFVALIFYLQLSSTNCQQSNAVGNLIGTNSSDCLGLGLLCDELDVIQDVLATAPSLVPVLEQLQANNFLEGFTTGEQNIEKDLPFRELVARYGYNLLSYTVTTEDGYKPILYRIQGSGDPVFLVHGLTNSAVDYFTVGKENALPILLAQNGYDVWLISCRGTTVEAQGHVNLTLPEDDDRYWAFSWDEIGFYDLPASIDYILQATGRTQVKYVGFSQGTTSFYVMASLRPAYAAKVSIQVSLAPIAWLSNAQSPLLRVLSPLIAPPPVSESLKQVVGVNKFDANNPLVQFVSKDVCGNAALAVLLCNSIVSALFGFDYGQINATQAPVIAGHYPSFISSRQLFHYGQLVNSGRFQRYDFGTTQNLARYGRLTPPDYPLARITTPVALFYTRANDWVSDYTDVLQLRAALPNVVDFYEVPFPTWTHFDHLWGKDVKALDYNRVLQLFQNY
ncbi:alpha/beta hydrolase fold domain-containing protein [Phthorimaea operculella]|nr:alpha/beta hydrolase fold domain-containing protein [Phthorimaea operculella]